jgi:hypothetical protein
VNSLKFSLKLFDHVHVRIGVNEFREHRPSIQLSLASFETVKNQKTELNPTKSEINKMFSQSNKEYGKTTKTAWETKDIINPFEMNKKNPIYKIIHENDFEIPKKQYSEVIIVDLNESELKEKLKKVQKKLETIERLKQKKNRNESLSESQIEKLKSEDKYKALIEKISNNLKL